jgi:hypothetical protein
LDPSVFLFYLPLFLFIIFIFSLYLHNPRVFGCCFPYLHITLKKVYPVLPGACYRVLISSLHTATSSLDRALISPCAFVARSWRLSFSLSTEKSSLKCLMFVIPRYFPVIIKPLYCIATLSCTCPSWPYESYDGFEVAAASHEV